MKKLLLVLMVVAMASFLLVGCLPGTTTPTTPTEPTEPTTPEICPTVAVTSQVAVGGKTYIKGGTQTITVTFAVPTEPVSVYVGGGLKTTTLPGEEVVMYTTDKKVYTGTYKFGTDNKCGEAYIYVETCETCAYCKYPYKVDSLKPADQIDVTAKGCTCVGCNVYFKTHTSTDACAGTTSCCGDACSGVASWSISIYNKSPFDTCCSLECATPIETCSGTACPVDCTTACLTVGTQYYVIISLVDNVGNEQKYYALLKVTSQGEVGKACTIELIPQTTMVSGLTCPAWTDKDTATSIGTCYK
ncbi:hypothetical protein CVT91_06055 [Candidatus Atribacteria bacterium HGW-Atribacteria-1]|nr:MAG: hypothetical protein CVT91_06055 [Candidatus Atribacteria bacterium HGW-Atribacteria-1]